MYIPAHFEESRPNALHDLIAQNPFGTLVTHGEHGLDANHIPFLLLPEEGERFAAGTLVDVLPPSHMQAALLGSEGA